MAASGAGAAPRARVSVDGTHFAANLPHPLFSRKPRMAPGAEETETLWVKNVSDQPLRAALRMAWNGGRNPRGFDDDLVFRAGSRHSTAAALRHEPLTIDLGTLAPGHVARASVTAALPLGSGNRSEDADIRVALSLLLSGSDQPAPSPSSPAPTSSHSRPPQPSSDTPDRRPSSGPSATAAEPGHPTATAGPNRPAEVGPDPGPGSPLPRTGAQALSTLLAAAACVGVGLLLVVLGRRRLRR